MVVDDDDGLGRKRWRPPTGPLERTDYGLFGSLLRWLPRQPAGQRRLTTSWTDILYYSSWRTVAGALGMLALLATAITVLRQFAVLRISVISFAVGAIKIPFDGFQGVDTFAPSLRSGQEAKGGDPAIWTQMLVTVLVLVVGRWFLRKIPEFALREEQEFREGCEEWSWPERVRACAIFGAAHLSNLWYPLASVAALSIGGGIFMWRYLSEYRRSLDREKAAKRAAALHAIYNGIAVLTIAVTLLVVVWY